MITRHLLSLALLFFFAVQGIAHPDHGSTAFEIDPVAISPSDTGTTVALRIATSLEDGVTLTAIGSDIGDVTVFDLPVTIDSEGDLVVHAAIEHAGTTPGIFSLILDFGAAGSGPVLVIPD